MNITKLTRVSRARKLTDGTGAQLRESARVSRQELAGVIGVDPATLARWENGSKSPHRENALAWLDALEALSSGHDR
ncbi:MAG: helix-turn-helix transcriptional regulator [Actinomycetota bacterium]